eukprot:8282453-Pyramimonas_sp.AAC.1
MTLDLITAQQDGLCFHYGLRAKITLMASRTGNREAMEGTGHRTAMFGNSPYLPWHKLSKENRLGSHVEKHRR